MLLSADLCSSFVHRLVFSRIVKDYSRVYCRGRPQQSSITTVVQSHKWGVSYAPAPSDIIWSVQTTLEVTVLFWWFLNLSGPNSILEFSVDQPQTFHIDKYINAYLFIFILCMATGSSNLSLHTFTPTIQVMY